MTTIADTEVVSDSTNVLALECAHRRREPAARQAQAPTRLAACHRMLRPRDGAHFALLALCTAGRDRGSFALQLDALREHLDWHARVITGHAPHLKLEVLLTTSLADCADQFCTTICYSRCKPRGHRSTGASTMTVKPAVATTSRLEREPSLRTALIAKQASM